MNRIMSVAAAGWLAIAAQAAVAQDIDFDEQIRPIFAANCYECHGPQRQRGDIRFDRREDIMAVEFTIVPGDAEDSEVHFRITLPADDPDRMPPEGDPLGEEQIDLIRRWIDAGADFGDWEEDPEAMRILEGDDPLPQVEPADEQALDLLRELGALAMPIAQNTNLLTIDFRTEADNIGDSHLDYLKPIAEQVAWLNLARTQVTDEGLARISGMKHLRRLHLENTAIGDEALGHLAAFEDLEYLNLYGTQVSDLGLITLARLDNLRKAFLWQTRVSEDGARALSRAHPELEINMGWEVLAAATEAAESAPEEPAEPRETEEPAEEAADPEEAEAPADPEEPEEPKLADADADADAEPAVAEADDAEPGDPINEACPFSGEPIDAAQTVVFAGQTIAFCCADCKGRFESDPEQFIDQVAEFERPDND